MIETADSPVRSLLLLWLLPRAKGGTLAQAKKDLTPLVSHRYSPGELAAQLEVTLEALTARGRIAQDPRGKLALTPDGRVAALSLLGLDALPPKTTWGAIWKNYLVARALGVPAKSAARMKKLGSAGGLRAAILESRCALPTQGAALGRAIEALAWKQLGVETDQPFSKNAVLAVLVNRALAADKEQPLKMATLQLPAKLVGARRADPDELRKAVLRGFFDGHPKGDDLPSFAARVLAAARACKTGWFGDNKVFISHVFAALGAGAGGGLPDFKHRLVEAHRKGMLVLSRADLVEVMNPADVAASETRHLSSTFHFVRIDER